MPIYKGFNNFQEASEFARKNIGPNFFVTPELKNSSQTIPYTIPDNKCQINFCDHCETMARAFRKLNQNNDTLTKDNQKLLRQNQILRDQIYILQDTLKQTQISSQNSSSPSQKMDEMGLHSPLNVNKSTALDKSVASPVQTATGKDISSPLMADTLPKSVRKLPTSFKLQNLTKDKDASSSSKLVKGFRLNRRTTKKDVKDFRKIIGDTVR